MKKAMRKPPMGLAAAAKYLGRRRLQAKQTAVRDYADAGCM
mgnify:CR=1 FL=1